MKTKRIDYIDLAKGICILFVVYGHCGCIIPEQRMPGMLYIGTFHVPIFFFISGLFFLNRESLNGGEFFKQKFVPLLIPFLFFYCVFSYCIPGILSCFGSNTFKEWNFESLWMSLWNETLLEGPLWFLLSLMEAMVLYFALSKVTNSSLTRVVVCLLFGGLGYLLGIYRIELPLFLDSTLISLMFFGFGVYLSHYIISVLDSISNNYLYIIAGITACGLYLFAGDLSYFQNIFHVSMISVVISSISGITLILSLSKIFERVPLINYCGRNTLLIMCTHITVMRLMQHVTRSLFDEYSVMAAIVLFVLTIVPYFLIIPFVNTYCPLILGRIRKQ